MYLSLPSGVHNNMHIDRYTYHGRTACIEAIHMILCIRSLAWASYQIRKIAGCACAGNAGNVSPRRRFQRKPLVSDPGMHHGTYMTHVPWCMPGSLACSDGETFPAFPAHAHPQFCVSGKRPMMKHGLYLAHFDNVGSMWRLHIYDVPCTIHVITYELCKTGSLNDYV